MKLNISRWVSFVLCLILFIVCSELIVWVVKKDFGATYFWNMEIAGGRNTINHITIGKYYYSWEVKSAFVDGDIVYISFYFPFSVIDDQLRYATGEYNISAPHKDDAIFLAQWPFYMLYNNKTWELTYLNAKKEILRWSENFNREMLKKLDASHTINLDKYHYETSFNDMHYGTGRVLLLRQFNDYLNSQISK